MLIKKLNVPAILVWFVLGLWTVALYCLAGIGLYTITEAGAPPNQEQPQLTYETSCTACTQADSSNEYYDIPLSEDVQEFITELSNKYQFSPSLIYGIIYVESRFNPDVKSNVGCVGLMQITPRYTDAWLTKAIGKPPDDYDIYDPYINITAGVQALSDWRDISIARGSDDIKDILEHYNKGYVHSIGNSTYSYANKVLEFQKFIEGGGSYG